jgi:branched-chain amino acid transport system ATP-binding protein
MSLLTLKDIHTYYGFSHVLHGMSLSVEEAQVVTLLGRNGMGKTTTLRSIMGLTPPKSGEITLCGRPIQHLPIYKIADLRIGYVPQGRRLFKSLTVREHLEVYYRKPSAGDAGEKGDWNTERVYRFFPRLKERQGNFASELSGGEQQMLAIARALVTNPQLLLMDEPTEGLAPLIVNEIGEIILMIKAEGYSVLLAEQKAKFALRLADEAYILSKGAIVHTGKAADVLCDENILQTYLGVQ